MAHIPPEHDEAWPPMPNPTPTPVEVEEARKRLGALIERLTAQQRQELLGEAVRDGDEIKLRFVRSAACRSALARKGILVDRMYSETLTPLGLIVRAALQHKDAGQ